MKKVLSFVLLSQLILSCMISFSPKACGEGPETGDVPVPVVTGGEAVSLDNGQVLYSKFAEKNSSITLRNESGDGCLIVMYTEFFNQFDNTDDGEIVFKFFVEGNSTVTLDCPAGLYSVRAVFGENYVPREDNLADYSMMTGRFSNDSADYIAADDVRFPADGNAEITVSKDAAEEYGEAVPYLYYVSENHSWADAHYNERIGIEWKPKTFYGWTYLVRSFYSDGYYEPF